MVFVTKTYAWRKKRAQYKKSKRNIKQTRDEKLTLYKKMYSWQKRTRDKNVRDTKKM